MLDQVGESRPVALNPRDVTGRELPLERQAANSSAGRPAMISAVCRVARGSFSDGNDR